MYRKSRFRLVLAALLSVGLIGGLLISGIADDDQPSSLRTPQAQAQIAHANDLSQAFRYVAREVQPSVVSISSVKKVRVASAPRSLPDLPDEFRGFFGDELFRRFESPQQMPRDYSQQGLGTGVIVSQEGYILTNNHVVANADEVTVTLHDDRQFDATVVGTDPKSDVAVLKIEATGLVASPLGNSDALQVGDWVLAIGSPFGLRQSVTAGIVSATGRANMGITDYEDFIQTDAAINPGNSGGPLVSMSGEVVGINTAIASRSGGYNGIGFAIPSNMARMVSDAIITKGRVDRGQLGAIIQNLTPELAESFGFEGTDGVLIGDVVQDSAADKAGLRSGDIVLKFDGRRMTDLHQLRNTVAATSPDTQVDVVIFRNGKEQTVKVQVGQLDSTSTANGATGGSESSSELGIKLQSLTKDRANELGYSNEQRGVIVTDVESGSLAARAGLQVDDVIVSINGSEVSTVNDFNTAIKEHDLSRGLRLQVLSGNFRRFLFLRGK